MITPYDVAKWMQEQIVDHEVLPQEEVAHNIERLFGDNFVEVSEGGNLRINPKVLYQFRKLTNATVVWDRYERSWYLKKPTDPPGRSIY